MNKYLKAVSTNLIFFFISTISFLILTPLAIHLMGKEFYGLWAVLNAVIGFSTIGTLGISSIVNKFAAESTPLGQEKSGSSILAAGFAIITPMALLTAGILWLIRNLIAGNLAMSSLLEHQFETAIAICIIGIIPQFLSRVPQGFLLSQLKNNLVRFFDFIASVFPLIGAVIICAFQKNLIWIAYCFTSIQFLTLFLYLIAVRQNLHLSLHLKGQIIHNMLGFSFFMFVESLAIALFQNFDRVLVGFILGPAIAGVYSVGTSVGLRISQITGQVTDTMIPYASLKNSLEDHEALYQTFRKLSQYIGLMVAIIASLCIIWMREILTIWISSSYAESYSTVFSVLILAYGFLSLSRPGDQTLTGLGQVKFASITYLLSTIIMLSGLYFLSQNVGLFGAAVANTFMILLVVMNLRAYQLLHHKIDWQHVFADLKWGILLPLLAYVAILFQPNEYLKICYTLVLIGYVTILVSKDNYLRGLLYELYYKIKRKNSTS
ncbi:MAG: oligosaccharide flippase family protein [Anaerolineaceae bacterium]|jgi:O-antigen/teichoic acid export membrane protein